jgi:hypothetical protein
VLSEFIKWNCWEASLFELISILEMSSNNLSLVFSTLKLNLKLLSELVENSDFFINFECLFGDTGLILIFKPKIKI